VIVEQAANCCKCLALLEGRSRRGKGFVDSFEASAESGVAEDRARRAPSVPEARAAGACCEQLGCEGHDSWVIGEREYFSLHLLGAEAYARR
jgi:hypothetical protein